MFELTDEMVSLYLSSIGKTRTQVVGFREIPLANNAIRLEVDIDNGHVKYTRVGYIWSNPSGEVGFKSITSKTRLHVPAAEVPRGAEVYLVDGTGPYLLDGPNGDAEIFAAYKYGGDGYGALLNSDDMVSVEFYYCNDGSMAGGRLMCPHSDIVAWINSLPDSGGDELVNRIVLGCKFDLWSLSYKLSTGKNSVFNMPEV